MITQSKLIKRAKNKGHHKDFIKIMLSELIEGCTIKGIDPIIPASNFNDWLEEHCNKPVNDYDIEQADQYYNLNEGDYKIHSNLLYWFIIELMGELK